MSDHDDRSEPGELGEIQIMKVGADAEANLPVAAGRFLDDLRRLDLSAWSFLSAEVSVALAERVTGGTLSHRRPVQEIMAAAIVDRLAGILAAHLCFDAAQVAEAAGGEAELERLAGRGT